MHEETVNALQGELPITEYHTPPPVPSAAVPHAGARSAVDPTVVPE